MTKYTVIELLKELSNGNTEQAKIYAKEQLALYMDTVIEKETYIEAYNNSEKKKILIDAHVDQIGLIVTHIEDNGLLKFASVGGVDPAILPASEVFVYGNEKISGVITSIPPHLSKNDKKKVKKIEDLYIDCGFSNKDEALTKVNLGDIITFSSDFKMLNENIALGKSFDDRSGIVAILYALDKLKNAKKCKNLVIILSDLEEIGEIGAKIAAKNADADIAIAVDVSFAKSTDEPKEKCGKLGKGPMLGISPTLNKNITKCIINAARKNNIPHQLEVMASLTSTNADQYSGIGIPSATVSIPLRYMHSPCEMLNVNDVINTGELLADYIMYNF
ncbi:hypothetical protein FACS1894132_07360 [Clostridia bacterium]|nr:hypothetical protein FACS1894132_07360 [Clostridia bacterium]